MAGQGSEQQWLLVTISTAGAPAATRVAVWRRLKSLGAVYLQQSTALLPATPATRRSMSSLADRVIHDGGTARVLRIVMRDPHGEAQLIQQQRADRDGEYAEVLERFPAFFAELDQEAARGRTTYEELEESEADLARFAAWLGKIAARDYFDAQMGQRARQELSRAESELARFAELALASHNPGQPPNGLDNQTREQADPTTDFD